MTEKIVSKRNLIKIYREIWRRISFTRKRQTVLAFTLIVFSAFAEMFAVLSIYPLLRVITSKKDILDDRLIGLFKNFLYGFNNQDLILFFTLLFVLSILFNAVIKLSNIFYSARLIAALGDDFGSFVFNKVLHLSYEEKVKQKSSDLIASINNHVPSTITGIEVTFNLISFGVTALFILFGMLIISIKVTIASLIIFVFIYYVILSLLRKRIYNYGKLIAENNISIVNYIQESFGSIREIILDNTFFFHKKRFKKSNKLRYLLNAKTIFLTASPRYFIEAITLSAIALYALYYSNNSLNSNYFIPALGSLALGMQKLLPALQQVYSASMNLSANNFAANMTLDVLNDESQLKILDDIQAENFTFKEKLTFEKVSFGYDSDVKVLRDINFEIFKGQKIGVVGETGSGKSTIIDLILGLLTPKEGNIYIDGERLDFENKQLMVNWRSIISHVPQQIFLTDTNYLENIALGIPTNQIDIKKVRKVSEIALIKDFIESSKYGFLSTVGERGIKLSGGQLQRIGIARSLYNNSQILVLDEATSALDNQTERRLMKSITYNFPNLTYIIIAHRLSTVSECDQIIYIKDGNILQIGKPEEIIPDLNK